MKVIADINAFITPVLKKSPKSPFDVPGIKTKAIAKDIVDAVREYRTSSSVPKSDAKKALE